MCSTRGARGTPPSSLAEGSHHPILTPSARSYDSHTQGLAPGDGVFDTVRNVVKGAEGVTTTGHEMDCSSANVVIDSRRDDVTCALRVAVKYSSRFQLIYRSSHLEYTPKLAPPSTG
jgi:hypothetical protein